MSDEDMDGLKPSFRIRSIEDKVLKILDEHSWSTSIGSKSAETTMALPAAMLMSGLTPERLNRDVKRLFGTGALLLLNSPSSVEIGKIDSEKNNPFSILSVDSKTIIKNLAPFFEFLYKANDEQKVQELESPKIEEIPPSPTPPPPLSNSCTVPRKDIKVMYQGRDILDLASNISWNWDFQPAVLREGVNSFFENRSQISRIGGANMPEHILVECDIFGCSFREPQFL